MTVNEYIAKLQALPDEARQLPALVPCDDLYYEGKGPAVTKVYWNSERCGTVLSTIPHGYCSDQEAVSQPGLEVREAVVLE